MSRKQQSKAGRRNPARLVVLVRPGQESSSEPRAQGANAPALSGPFAAFCQRGEELEREHRQGWARHEALEESPEARTPEPARRARLRWIVGAVLSLALILLVSGAVKAAGQYRAKRSYAAQPPPVPTVPEPRPLPAAAIASGTAPVAESAKLAPPASPAPAPAPISGAAARKEAERLLSFGRFKDAVPAARAAIEAEPEHALGYLLLGSALQSTGRWNEGVAAYSQCVHLAKKGPVAECRALGGR